MNSLTLLIISIIILIIGFILTCYFENPFFLPLSVAIVCFCFIIHSTFENDNIIKRAEMMVENGAKVYINGIETDASKIDFDHYKITIKDEEILLCPK